MFRDNLRKGYISILYSCGASPLEFWGTHVENGYIRRVTDKEINSLALEIAGTNVSTSYIYIPKDKKTKLGIDLTFLIMVIKNMRRYFTFEVTILDDKKMHRRFRVSNFQSSTKIRPFCTSMPMGISGGWNQIQFNLADFCKKAYGSNYMQTTKMQIHANCRIRRIYFADRLYQEDELPAEYRISEFIRKCVKEGDKHNQAKQDSKTGLSTSNQSQTPPTSYEEAEVLSVIQSEASGAPVTPEEHIKLQIDIPTAEYETEINHLSTGQVDDTDDELLEDPDPSIPSIADNQEDYYKSP